MLSAQLADQQSIDDFVKDKTDRQIAVAGLTIIDQHVKGCELRWNKVQTLLRYVGIGVMLIISERVATDVHWSSVFDIAKYFLGL